MWREMLCGWVAVDYALSWSQTELKTISTKLDAKKELMKSRDVQPQGRDGGKG